MPNNTDIGLIKIGVNIYLQMSLDLHYTIQIVVCQYGEDRVNVICEETWL